MTGLSDLELAILNAIADQSGAYADDLRQQIASANVIGRRNTGVGFYTSLAVSGHPPRLELASPVGDIGADVEGVPNGMGFLLWLRDGLLSELEGYTYADSTEGRDVTALGFSNIGRRLG